MDIALRMCVRTVSGDSTSASAIWAPLSPPAIMPEDLPLPNGERRSLAVAASGSVAVFGQLSSVSRLAALLNGDACSPGRLTLTALR